NLIITTGRKGNVFLEPGDIVKCEIESLGFIENKVV
ncbi:MAG: 5-carboxymethyl-2-hydroxymuconate isomerase, partial [Flavobacteriales bacterium]|nr:5-carboxymethyl-2-hydroxymuconate isomerase [Flavobacteriales bacterium]